MDVTFSKARTTPWDAVSGVDAQALSGGEKDFRIRLGAGDLVAVDQRLEAIQQAGAAQDEIHVFRFSVSGQRAGDAGGVGGADEILDAGDKVFEFDRSHELAIEAFLIRAVAENFVGGQVRAKDIADDLVVPLAQHALHDPFGGDAEAVEVFFPGAGMEGGGFHDHAIHVEEQGETGGH